ncbi:MAG: DUF2283 domain-containing protein [Candidatus Hydrogenedentes bacterium]|nr:DUF2283 domain-containing protein [Candidatus Hydrogenedentota bacterium]MBI3119131.1 DUF2283 domain-containing protein [Candidatus Hydrogenedentota bacterium]
MAGQYLQVTYRHGRPFAAYYYLPRQSGDRSCRSEVAGPGLVVDFRSDGRPIGIELTAPDKVSLAALNKVLLDLGLPLASAEDLAPLPAA